MNAQIWVNGQKVAAQAYGYTSFVAPLSSALKPGAVNVIAVRVDNTQQPNSRWYTGSGIYRHVWLNVASPVHVAPWGVFARTTEASDSSATVLVSTKVNNGPQARTVTVRSALLEPNGKEVAFAESPLTLASGTSGELQQTLKVANPALWSPERPQLSKVQTRILEAGKGIDSVETSFGIRSLAWSTDNGLTLNGKGYKLNGGCIHQVAWRTCIAGGACRPPAG